MMALIVIVGGSEYWIYPYSPHNSMTMGVEINSSLFNNLLPNGPHFDIFQRIQQKADQLQHYYNMHGQPLYMLTRRDLPGQTLTYDTHFSIFLAETKERYPMIDQFLAFLEKTSILDKLPKRAGLTVSKKM